MPEQTKKWNRLYAYEAEIFGYIKNSVGNSEIARDLFQDVYLQALLNLEKLDSDRSLKNWLKTVARNRVINYFREHKRRKFEDIDEDFLTSEIEEDDLRPMISRAIQFLPVRQREIIRLREIEGLSYQEIGLQFKLSESGVTSLLKRARISLKKLVLMQMLPEWFAHRSEDFELDDLGRFINTFDHAENLFLSVERRSQDFFHHIRDDWNKWQRFFIREEKILQLEQILGDQKGKRLLDLGCGTGFLANRFLEHGAKVVAIDLNRTMLQLAKITSRAVDPGFYTLQADVRSLPLRGEQFNQVFFVLVLHHLSDPSIAVREAGRALKKSGKLVIIDFLRHRNHEMADLMRDLWLGFKPKTIEMWCNKSGLYLESEQIWESEHNIDVFMQVYNNQQNK